MVLRMLLIVSSQFYFQTRIRLIYLWLVSETPRQSHSARECLFRSPSLVKNIGYHITIPFLFEGALLRVPTTAC